MDQKVSKRFWQQTSTSEPCNRTSSSAPQWKRLCVQRVPEQRRQCNMSQPDNRNMGKRAYHAVSAWWPETSCKVAATRARDNAETQTREGMGCRRMKVEERQQRRSRQPVCLLSLLVTAREEAEKGWWEQEEIRSGAAG